MCVCVCVTLNICDWLIDEIWIMCVCVCDFEYMWLTNRWNMNNVCVCVTLNICDWLIDEIWIMCVCVCVCVWLWIYVIEIKIWWYEETYQNTLHDITDQPTGSSAVWLINHRII